MTTPPGGKSAFDWPAHPAADSDLSVEPVIVASMFELTALTSVDPHANEAALIGQIARLEQLKSAAAAGQARATAALDEKRRAEEAAAGVRAAKPRSTDGHVVVRVSL